MVISSDGVFEETGETHWDSHCNIYQCDSTLEIERPSARYSQRDASSKELKPTTSSVPLLDAETSVGTAAQDYSARQNLESVGELSSSTPDHDYDPDFSPGTSEDENEAAPHTEGDEDPSVNDRVVDKDRS